MNRIKNLVAVSAFSLLILGLPAIASAQWRDRDDDDDGYSRNDDHHDRGRNNGRNNNRNNIRSTVRNLKNKAKNFERATDRYNDRRDDRDDHNRGRWGGNNNNQSGNLENLAGQFKDATDDLENAYGNGRNLNNSADEARRVLDIASQIDRAIYNSRGGRNIQGQWNSMRQDLNVLSNAYGYNYNNRNNRRNNRNGNWRNSIPFPLPF